jgi:hypothetical protein
MDDFIVYDCGRSVLVAVMDMRLDWIPHCWFPCLRHRSNWCHGESFLECAVDRTDFFCSIILAFPSSLELHSAYGVRCGLCLTAPPWHVSGMGCNRGLAAPAYTL